MALPFANFLKLSAILDFFRKNKDIFGEVTKTTLEPEGLDDDSLFTNVVTWAKFKNGKVENGPFGNHKQWKLFEETLEKMETEDRKNGTLIIRNFRIIVASDQIGRSNIQTTQGQTTVAAPDQNWVHPGIYVIQDIITRCKTEKDIRRAINVSGANQEAAFGVKDHAKKLPAWLKKQVDNLFSGLFWFILIITVGVVITFLILNQ